MRLAIKSKPIPIWRWLASLILGVALVGLPACATGPKLTDHAFEFNASSDSPGVEILNYQYGNSNLPGTRLPPALLREGGVSGGTGINGPMPRGDSLYVKWRIKSTGEVFEDTVDLKRRLPADITRHRIYFIVKGSQLYVYLISPEKLNPNPCPSREELRRLGKADSPDDRIFSTFCYLKITRIYPDQPEQNKFK